MTLTAGVDTAQADAVEVFSTSLSLTEIVDNIVRGAAHRPAGQEA
jgi:hypothetical protein